MPMPMSGASQMVAVTVTFKADSHIPCRSHAVSMPFPYHATNVPFCKRPLKAIAGSWQGGDGRVMTY
jgi:hypothetical protein